ncbi:IS200/IS605 family transposase [Microseira wollei]|uniref:Transposase IS200-family protein n=1 Tax=Microseira wollei NIES-4236 TaxID=2530354 RepID=A0AAV3XPA0_9CYAN|nr:IS200/IS605 family transposase [Microseira wollei]GET44543.1 transposase IS200-family protein [Microseira wollei NIES-4236]
MKANNRQYRHNNHSVGAATVHLVWIPKRRKPVLVGDVKLRLSQILTEVANEKQSIIKCLEIAPAHVHLLVEYDPNTPINSIVKAFKGRSSRYLRQEFPHLLKLPTLWTHAYFYDSTGKVSSAIIEAYINDPHHSK